jgi:hypothetical protein
MLAARCACTSGDAGPVDTDSGVNALGDAGGAGEGEGEGDWWGSEGEGEGEIALTFVNDDGVLLRAALGSAVFGSGDRVGAVDTNGDGVLELLVRPAGAVELWRGVLPIIPVPAPTTTPLGDFAYAGGAPWGTLDVGDAARALVLTYDGASLLGIDDGGIVLEALPLPPASIENGGHGTTCSGEVCTRGLHAAAFGDRDGDGDDDITLLGPTGWVAERIGPSTFTASVELPVIGVDGFAGWLKVENVVDTGEAIVAFATGVLCPASPSIMGVGEGEGEGEGEGGCAVQSSIAAFTRTGPLTVTLASRVVTLSDGRGVVADLDGDGDTEIVAAEW